MSKNPLHNALRPHRLSRAAGIRSAVWGTVFGTAGVLHFVKPEGFDRIVPEELPGTPRAWTLGSGAMEIALATSIAVCSLKPEWRGALRSTIAPAAALFLVGVLPGNIKMAWDWRAKPQPARAIAFARVPLQLPMILSVAKLGA
ncbi:hypothetical protein [Corynebacterium sp. c24Ua_83]|uniref:DoxX family protein n=1 Tax=Corynebacterium sp. c24Ua_83 TaxID=3032350 RepID=UPI0032651A0A